MVNYSKFPMKSNLTITYIYILQLLDTFNFLILHVIKNNFYGQQIDPCYLRTYFTFSVTLSNYVTNVFFQALDDWIEGPYIFHIINPLYIQGVPKVTSHFWKFISQKLRKIEMSG